jgi:hypothetical protein
MAKIAAAVAQWALVLIAEALSVLVRFHPIDDDPLLRCR